MNPYNAHFEIGITDTVSNDPKVISYKLEAVGIDLFDPYKLIRNLIEIDCSSGRGEFVNFIAKKYGHSKIYIESQIYNKAMNDRNFDIDMTISFENNLGEADLNKYNQILELTMTSRSGEAISIIYKFDKNNSTVGYSYAEAISKMLNEADGDLSKTPLKLGKIVDIAPMVH